MYTAAEDYYVRRKTLDTASNRAYSRFMKSKETLHARLSAEGLFKGHDGLEGLANADEFWEQQPYGTRIYYGDGAEEYLHRSVLRAVIDALSDDDWTRIGHDED